MTDPFLQAKAHRTFFEDAFPSDAEELASEAGNLDSLKYQEDDKAVFSLYACIAALNQRNQELQNQIDEINSKLVALKGKIEGDKDSENEDELSNLESRLLSYDNSNTTHQIDDVLHLLDASEERVKELGRGLEDKGHNLNYDYAGL